MLPKLQTSAALLWGYSQQRLAEVAPEQRVAEQQRALLASDLYIKARSYALINKVCFWLSMLMACLVLLWPSLLLCWPKLDWLQSSVVQTTLTGLAAMSFALYNQYKNKQTYTENLMRYLVFSTEPIELVSTRVIDELAKIDRGFSFNAVVAKDGDS